MAIPITIAGAGNWMVTTDRIGSLIVKQVQGRYAAEIVEVCSIGGAALALLDIIHSQELLLLIDACNGQDIAGKVRCYAPNLNSVTAITGTLHQIGPLETLLIAKHLYPETLPKRILFITIETENLDAELEIIACKKVIAILDREIENWLKLSSINYKL